MRDPSAVRLNKFISESGMCSRREADRYIENGHVFINGKRASVGDQVKIGDVVRVNGIELEPRQGEDLVFIALNKPPGITSTTEQGVRDNIIQFVNHSIRIFPIGRLDKDSQGLIFLTNDGDIVNKILRAGNKHEKEYVVTVNKPIGDDTLSAMSNGVPMLGVMTRKCRIERISSNTFRIVLIQGLNRQIRRMCEHFGFEVLKLERTRIMNVSLKGLPLGDWRDLSESEVNAIFEQIKDSSSESNKKQTGTSIKTKENAHKPHSSNKSYKSRSHHGSSSGSHNKGQGNKSRNKGSDKRGKKRR